MLSLDLWKTICTLRQQKKGNTDWKAALCHFHSSRLHSRCSAININKFRTRTIFSQKLNCRTSWCLILLLKWRCTTQKREKNEKSFCPALPSMRAFNYNIAGCTEKRASTDVCTTCDTTAQHRLVDKTGRCEEAGRHTANRVHETRMHCLTLCTWAARSSKLLSPQMLISWTVFQGCFGTTAARKIEKSWSWQAQQARHFISWAGHLWSQVACSSKAHHHTKILVQEKREWMRNIGTEEK